MDRNGYENDLMVIVIGEGGYQSPILFIRMSLPSAGVGDLARASSSSSSQSLHLVQSNRHRIAMERRRSEMNRAQVSMMMD